MLAMRVSVHLSVPTSFSFDNLSINYYNGFHSHFQYAFILRKSRLVVYGQILLIYHRVMSFWQPVSVLFGVS